MTRPGKTARLPQAVRERLNRRLRGVEPGDPLAEAYRGGEAGHQAAAFFLEFRHDLERETLTRKPELGPTESNPVKPSQT